MSLEFSNLCGSKTLIQSINFFDLDQDGKKEMIITAWCDLNALGRTDLVGTPYDGPVANALYIYKVNSNGKYINATADLVGTNAVTLEGAVGYVQFADFNQDGRTDILLAPNKEDGRQPYFNNDGTSNWNTRLQVLRSSANAYVLDSVGDFSSYHHDASIVKNGNGKWEIISGGYRYSHENNSWNRYASLLSPDGKGVKEFSNNSNSYAIVQHNYGTQIDPRFGFNLKKRSYGENWTTLQEYSIAVKQDVMVNSSGSQERFSHISLNGVTYLSPAMTEMCISSEASGKKRVNILFSGIPLKPSANLNNLSYDIDFTWQDMVFAVLSYSISSESISAALNPFVFPVKPVVTDSLNCKDIDGDGNLDVIVPTYTSASSTEKALPFILISTNGGWRPIDKSKYTDITLPNWSGTSMSVDDISEDGSISLIYYPLLGTSQNSNYSGNLGPRIYKLTNKQLFLN